MKDLGLVGLGVITAITFTISDSFRSREHSTTAQACVTASKDSSKFASEKKNKKSAKRQPASEKVPAIYSVPGESETKPRSKGSRKHRVQVDFVSDAGPVDINSDDPFLQGI
ncbi:MAG: hypothetical protein ABL958_08790 [Bdellovibrionia bacterium]